MTVSVTVRKLTSPKGNKFVRYLLSTRVGEHLASLYLRIWYAFNGRTLTIQLDPFEATFIARNDSHAERIRKIARVESDLIQEIARRIQPDDVFADVGADFGFYTCLLSSYVGDDQVFGVEPYPPRIARMLLNLRLNDSACQIDRRAWGGSTHQELSGYTTVFERGAPEVISGDDAISDGLPRPTVLKIDVDGGEFDVLKGLTKHLESSIRLIYVEVHPVKLSAYGRTPHDVEELLDRSGFRVSRLFNRQEGDAKPYYLVAECGSG